MCNGTRKLFLASGLVIKMYMKALTFEQTLEHVVKQVLARRGNKTWQKGCWRERSFFTKLTQVDISDTTNALAQFWLLLSQVRLRLTAIEVIFAEVIEEILLIYISSWLWQSDGRKIYLWIRNTLWMVRTKSK